MATKDTVRGLAILVGWLVSRTDPPAPKLTPEQVQARVEESRKRLADIRAQVAATMPPGWYDILSCTPFSSFDGSQTILLIRNNTVLLGNISGTWSFDSTTRRYTISVDGQTNSYTLMNGDSNNVCILIAGSPTSANLERSWFAHVEESSDPGQD
jgi:hypothetical protein